MSIPDIACTLKKKEGSKMGVIAWHGKEVSQKYSSDSDEATRGEVRSPPCSALGRPQSALPSKSCRNTFKSTFIFEAFSNFLHRN